MAESTLIRTAQDSEDVASGLQAFRNTTGREGASITTMIGQLYSISALLNRLDDAASHPDHRLSFYRIRRDVAQVTISLQLTLGAALEMFGRTRVVSYTRAWLDMNHHMTNEEGVTFRERLDWYAELLGCCILTLQERPCPHRDEYYDRVGELLQSQQLLTMPERQPALGNGYRPLRSPTSPTSSDDPRPPGFYPVFAPEVPLSPTQTNDSGQTYESSQTSLSLGYGSADHHWAQDIFNGNYPNTKFSTAAHS